MPPVAARLDVDARGSDYDPDARQDPQPCLNMAYAGFLTPRESISPVRDF
jgi:hypothetical protein